MWFNQTSLKFVHKDPSCPARLDEFLMYFLKFMITNKISTEMPLQGNLAFYECPHSVTLSLSISRVCIYKHSLFILIYI